MPMALLTIYTFFASALAAQLLVEPTSRDNSPSCDCYLTSGPDPGYFQYHRFWDFRNIPSDSNGDNYTIAPPLVTDSESAGLEPSTSLYLNTTRWNTDWQIQTWASSATNDSPIRSVNSPRNVYISSNSSLESNKTYLTLRASRLTDFMSIAEIDSQQKNLFYSSIRARLRVVPNGLSNTSDPSSGNTAVTDAGSIPDHPVDPGAVAGLFTYYSATVESDIEILTSDPTDRIRYSNQPDFNYKTGNTVPGASTAFAMPHTFDWTEWLDHRLDWHNGITRWYINDQFMLNKTENVPTDPSGLILNLWGDGGEWSGNLSVGGQVQLGVEWIEMVFNVSGPVEGLGSSRSAIYQGGGMMRRKTSVCHVGCTIDGVAQVGFPEQVFNSTSSSDANSVPRCQSHMGMVSAVALVVLGMICSWAL